MIEVAKTKADESNIKNVHYAHATIFDERYQKESFNVILSFRVLHMLEDIQAVAHRINELLKPGGFFISVTACMGEKKALLSIAVFLASKMRIVPQHINMFRLSELEALMTGENYQIIECEKMEDSIPHYFIVARKL
jgi:2-polyprenyl-3-methyl-5-hydroxy-6-metoxy-1,4-benzoquinol methylase